MRSNTVARERGSRSGLSFLFSLIPLIPLTSGAVAQDLTVKAPPQASEVMIFNATIHPVSGPDIPSGFVFFDHGVITEVGAGMPPVRGRTPGAGGRKGAIDARGGHVYPGLISAVTRLGLTEIPTVRAMGDSSELGSITPEVKALVAVNPDSTLIPVTRAAGILTAGVFPSGGLVAGQPAVVRLDAWTTEEMGIVPSMGLLVNYPSARPFGRRFFGPQQSPEEAGAEVRRNLDALDEVFKTAKAYGAARDADPATPIDIRWESMRAVFAPAPPLAGGAGAASEPGGAPVPAQRPVFLQANDADQITQAVTWAVGLGLKPVIVGGRDAVQCADLLVRHKVPVIVQGVHNLPRRDDAPYDAVYALPAQLESLGVRWCMGSGEETAHERNLATHAGRAAAYGLARAAALRSITLSPAEILGVADKLGSLESAKAATLIVTDGDILEVETHVTHAFVDGRQVDLSNKQSKLYEKYRERYRQMGLLKDQGETRAGP